MANHSKDNAVTVLLTLMFTTLPPVTLLVFAYILASDIMFAIVRFFGKRVNSSLRSLWRIAWLSINVAVFGSVLFYMLRECILPLENVDGFCNKHRPLEHQPCLVLACATCVMMLLALFADRIIGPFVGLEPEETVYERRRVERVAWGAALVIAWAAVSDLDSTAILLLFGLSARRALEPWVASSLLRPAILVYKGMTIWIMGRTLSHHCTLLVPRLAVGSVLAILMW